MKKTIAAIMAVCMLSTTAHADFDYSLLDDLSVSELEELQEEIGNRLSITIQPAAEKAVTLGEDDYFEFSGENPFLITENSRKFSAYLKEHKCAELKEMCKMYVEENNPDEKDAISRIYDVFSQFDFDSIVTNYDEFEKEAISHFNGYEDITNDVHVFMTYNTPEFSSDAYLHVGFVKEDGWFFADEVKLKRYDDYDSDGYWRWNARFSRDVIKGSTVKEWYKDRLNDKDIDYIGSLSTEDKVGIRFINRDDETLDFNLSSDDIVALATMAQYIQTIQKVKDIYMEAKNS